MKTKIYECDHNQKLISIIEVDIESAPMLLEFFSNTDKAPSKAMLVDYESGDYDLYFDYIKKKWSKKQVDKSNAINIATEILNKEIFTQIDDGTFEYSDLTFYTNDETQLKLSEIASAIYLDIAEFPISVKSSGNSYLIINSATEFSAFYKKFAETRNKIREIGRTIKYGGTIGDFSFISFLESDLSELELISGYSKFRKLSIVEDNCFKTIFERILYPEQFIEEDEA